LGHCFFHHGYINFTGRKFKENPFQRGDLARRPAKRPRLLADAAVPIFPFFFSSQKEEGEEGIAPLARTLARREVTSTSEDTRFARSYGTLRPTSVRRLKGGGGLKERDPAL